MNESCEIITAFKCSSIAKYEQAVFALISIVFFISIVLPMKAMATEPSKIAEESTEAKSVNAQNIWKKTCFTCHGDSGDMARNFLSVVDGELQGPMHKASFRTFLTNHYLSKLKAGAVYSMLLTQAKAKSRFEQECGSCHQKMDDLIREKLALHNGILYSRQSETPTYGFLETHRGLSKDDVKYFMKKLTFRGYEIYRPVKME